MTKVSKASGLEDCASAQRLLSFTRRFASAVNVAPSCIAVNMATNPWAAVKPTGAWASQVEEEEAAQGGALAAPEEAFPDLSVAATKKESKRDKKGRKQTLSLAEFQSGKKSAYQAPKRAAPKEEIVLPSGPRARDDDDEGNSRGGLGGAFAGGRDFKDRGKDRR